MFLLGRVGELPNNLVLLSQRADLHRWTRWSLIFYCIFYRFSLALYSEYFLAMFLICRVWHSLMIYSLEPDPVCFLLSIVSRIISNLSCIDCFADMIRFMKWPRCGCCDNLRYRSSSFMLSIGNRRISLRSCTLDDGNKLDRLV